VEVLTKYELSMANFQKLVHGLKNPVLSIDTNLKFEFVNASFCSITGFAKTELIGRPIFKIIQKGNNSSLYCLLQEPKISKDPEEVHVSITLKDGSSLQAILRLFLEEIKGIKTYSAIIDLIPHQVPALEKSVNRISPYGLDENYKTLYNLTFEGVIIHDKGITLDANPAFTQMMGYNLEEIIGTNIINLCVLPAYKQKVMEAMKMEKTGPYEVQAITKSGSILHTEVESRQIVSDNKSVRVTAIRDITARKEAQQKLIESEERYRLLSSITFEGIFLHDKGVIIDANESLAKMIGYELEEIIGENIIQLVVLPEYHGRVAEALKNEETKPYVVQVRRKDGSLFHAEVEAGMVNAKGKQLRVTAARDVTWRIEAEKKLRENEEMLNTFFSQSADGFFIMTMDEPAAWEPGKQVKGLLEFIMANMRITKINDAMVRQYRTTDSKLHQHSLEELFEWNDLYGKKFVRELLDKGHLQFEMAEPRHDNSIMWIEGNYLVLYNDDGKIRGCCGVRREVSDRKKAEEEVKRHNKELRKTNQELDNFVYMVSHDLKAPIASTKGLINIALLETEKDRIKTCLNLIESSMSKLDSFILDILNYSRNSRIEVEPALIDFDELIKDTLAHTKYLQDENKVTIEIDIDDKVSLFSDRQRLVFIFNNMVSNAIRFVDESKTKNFLNIRIKVTSEKANIIFQDNGIGIDKDHLERIFEMFYRANDQKVGSGLGLYIVKESIDKIGGSIKVESEIDIGTCFVIDIPNMLAQ